MEAIIGIGFRVTCPETKSEFSGPLDVLHKQLNDVGVSLSSVWLDKRWNRRGWNIMARPRVPSQDRETYSNSFFSMLESIGSKDGNVEHGGFSAYSKKEIEWFSHVACRVGRWEVIRQILAIDRSSVLGLDEIGMNALSWAVAFGQAIPKDLGISSFELTSISNNYYANLLDIAVWNGLLTFAQELNRSFGISPHASLTKRVREISREELRAKKMNPDIGFRGGPWEFII